MEQPIKTLSPIKRMPFTLVVAMRLLVLIPGFGVSVLMMITGISGLYEGDIIELPTLLLGIAFFVITSYFLLKIFVLEKIRLSQLQYLFYSDRLVIYNEQKNQILREVLYDQFPDFTFHENLTNFGYIVIGKNEPVMARGGNIRAKLRYQHERPGHYAGKSAKREAGIPVLEGTGGSAAKNSVKK